MTRLALVSLAARRRLCAAHLGLIAVLSLVPAWLFPPSAAGVPGLDKAAHVLMYGILGILFRWAADESSRWSADWKLPMAGAAYGLLMEGFQLWFSGGTRAFSWGDALANLAGVALFWHGTGRILNRFRAADGAGGRPPGLRQESGSSGTIRPIPPALSRKG
ncbi:MAG: VanZ family protein, partial [Lentisphaerae bacterium]|nr:VanZ family protein [Lentisphaerota bacterium]